MNIHSFGLSLIYAVYNIDKISPLGTPYQYTVEFFVYFYSFQISYFDKAFHTNVDTWCFHEHFADVKYVTV